MHQIYLQNLFIYMKKTGFKFKVDCVLLNKDSYSFASEKTVLFCFFLSFLVLQ